MSAPLDALLATDLAALSAQHRLRRCPNLGNAGPRTTVDGLPLLAFTSNDYLGLARDPRLRDAAQQAIATWGTSATASRLVSGDLPPHRDLEAALAHWLGSEAALAFPTGYQANLGVVTALADRTDLIASDALNHASLIDGCRLSRATVARYSHADPDDAARALATPGTFRRRFLVTESVFSMDGDTPPLRALADVASRAGAFLIVDEAHALGVLGPGGRGLAAQLSVRPDVVVGTLGKALGSAGGFVAGSHALCATLVNRARTFLFTTGMAPAAAAAAATAVRLTAGSEGDSRRAHLYQLIRQLRSARGASSPEPPTPILPVILGTDAAALAAAATLREQGIFTQPIRPPTVPEGTARLRITLSADHTADDVRQLTSALDDLLR